MDKIKVQILDDGVVKTTTGAIGKKNHLNADELMELLDDFIGEAEIVEQKAHKHVHEHRQLHLKH